MIANPILHHFYTSKMKVDKGECDVEDGIPVWGEHQVQSFLHTSAESHAPITRKGKIPLF